MKLNEALQITLKCYEFSRKPFYKAIQARTKANSIIKNCCNKDKILLKTKFADAIELYSFDAEFSRDSKVKAYSRSVLRYLRAVGNRL